MDNPTSDEGRLTRARAAQLGITLNPRMDLPSRRVRRLPSASEAAPRVVQRLPSESSRTYPGRNPSQKVPNPVLAEDDSAAAPTEAPRTRTKRLAGETPGSYMTALTSQITELNRLVARVTAEGESQATTAAAEPLEPQSPRLFTQAEVNEQLENRVVRLTSDLEARVSAQVSDRLVTEHSRAVDRLLEENTAIRDRLATIESLQSRFNTRQSAQDQALKEVRAEVSEMRTKVERLGRAAHSAPVAKPQKSQPRESSEDDQFHTARDRVIKQKLNYSSGDESESDSDAEPQVEAQHMKGPKQRGLSELKCSDRLFQPIISYRRYRLRLTDQVIDDMVTGNAGLNHRRLEHTLKNRKFTGSEPLRILSFLSLFKAQCDNNRITEGGALILLPNFLEGEAYELFMSNQDMGEDNTGGFATYPEAVQFLLRSFAREAYIETAVEAFDRLTQNREETELGFSRRLREANRKLGSAYSEEELIRRFIRGLDPSVKPLLTRAARAKRFRSLISTAEYAGTIGDSYRATKAASKPPIGTKGEKSILRPPTRRVAAVEGDAINALEESQLPGMDAQSEGSSQIALADAFAAGMKLVQPDVDVNAVIYGEHERLPPYARPTRQQKPGWVAPDASKAICYECLGKDHFSPECPHKARERDMDTEAKFQRLRETNFCLLTEKERNFLRSNGRNPFALSEPPTRPPSATASEDQNSQRGSKN